MTNNIPTLPPSFLERCLAFSEHLHAMKSGSAKLEASPSHFFFSVDHPPGIKESGPSRSQARFFSPNGWKLKKKSPSDLRRNARRHEEFLERKRNSCQPAASPSNPPPPPDLQTSADLSNLSSISETPLHVENTEDMDTESSDLQSSEAIPESDDTRKDDPVTESRSKKETKSDDIPSDGILPIISHLNSPSEATPEEPKHEEKTNHVRILICAEDQNAAMKRCNQFQNSKMIGPHKSDKLHHFMFSTHLNDRIVTKMKTDIDKYEDILMLSIVKEKKLYHPTEDNKHHCNKCPQLGFG